jgi:hypothetical protein
MHVLRQASIAAALLSMLAGSWTLAVAQDRITALLRNGQRISGELDGVVDDRVYIRVSRDEQPKVPLNDIAVIDVGGDATNLPDSEVREARGAAHLLVPRDGPPVKGRLVTIEGSLGNVNDPKPPVVVFRSEAGEERRVPVSQVKRLYLGNFPAEASSTSGTGSIATGERVVSVPATSQWMDTGLVVRQGDKVSLTASGEITLSADPNDKARPGGSVTQRRSPNAPLPNVSAGTLIGRVATRARNGGAVFAIGDQTTVDMPATGRLYLGVNDDHTADNSGQFEVRIRADQGATRSDDAARYRRQ